LTNWTDFGIFKVQTGSGLLFFERPIWAREKVIGMAGQEWECSPGIVWGAVVVLLIPAAGLLYGVVAVVITLWGG